MPELSLPPGLIPQDIILEYTQVGSAMRVSAVDPHSGTEIAFQAPRQTSASEIHRLALAKLAYVINKKNASN